MSIGDHKNSLPQFQPITTFGSHQPGHFESGDGPGNEVGFSRQLMYRTSRIPHFENVNNHIASLLESLIYLTNML